MEPIAFQLVLLIIFGAIAAAIASNKGRSAVGWFFGGFFLGLIGIIVVAVLPNLKTQREKEARIERENRRLREQLRQEQIKGEAFRQHAAARLDAHDVHLGMDTRHTLPATGAALQLEALGGASLDDASQSLEMLASPTSATHAQPPTYELGPASDAHRPTVHVNAAAPQARPARQWHYELAGEARGPIDEPALLGMVRSGEIAGGTLLWTDGFDDWKPADSIPALRPHLTA